MDYLELPKEYTIPCTGREKFVGIAFDGCYYYLLMNYCSQIHQYNACFEEVGCFETCRKYHCFCYDWAADCFWAASRESPNTLFRLDSCFCEVERIFIAPKHAVCGNITGLSSLPCGEVLASYPGGVLSLHPRQRTAELVHRAIGGCVTGVVSAFPGYLITQVYGAEQSVTIFDAASIAIQNEVVPCGVYLEQMLLCSGRRVMTVIALITESCTSKVIIKKLPADVLGFCVTQRCCKQEPCRPDPCRPDPCRPDPCRPDPCRPDPCRPDPCRPDPCRPDPCRPDPCRPDPCRPDPCRPDPCRPDPCRPDPCHPDPCHPESCCPEEPCHPKEPCGNPCRPNNGYSPPKQDGCSRPHPCGNAGNHGGMCTDGAPISPQELLQMLLLYLSANQGGLLPPFPPLPFGDGCGCTNPCRWQCCAGCKKPCPNRCSPCVENDSAGYEQPDCCEQEDTSCDENVGNAKGCRPCPPCPPPCPPCPPPCPPCPPPCPWSCPCRGKYCAHCPCREYCGCGKPCDEAACVMESIALMEAALSHILNAEGEKLQKILACTEDVDVILRVNQEIRQTVVSATHLEQLLYEKLVALEKYPCPKPPHPPCGDCDPCCDSCSPCGDPCEK